MGTTSLVESHAGPDPERFPVRTWLISFAGWMFDFYDLVLFSFLLIPIGYDLHLSDSEEAVMLGTALGASGVGGVLFGYVSDRVGRKRAMTWTILLFSLGTALTALATGPLTLLLCRFLTGLGVGGEWAVGHALLAESAPPRMRGRAAALLQTGEPVGVGLAAVVGLLVAPLIGWRAAFLASSGSAVLALMTRRFLPESALWEKQEQKPSLAAAIRLMSRLHLWGVLFKGWVLGLLKLGTYWTCYIWLPRFLQEEFHQPIGRSVLWILTAQLGQLLGMLAFGFVADHYGRRRAFTAFSLLTAAALYPLAFHWSWLLTRPLFFWLDLFALGLGAGCTAGFGALLAELFPTQVRNFAMGATYNGARGVQFFAPLVVAAFVSVCGLTGGLGVPLVLALATAGWVWMLPETHARDLGRIAGSTRGIGLTCLRRESLLAVRLTGRETAAGRSRRGA
jgi:MFS family permease